MRCGLSVECDGIGMNSHCHCQNLAVFVVTIVAMDTITCSMHSCTSQQGVRFHIVLEYTVTSIPWIGYVPKDTSRLSTMYSGPERPPGDCWNISLQSITHCFGEFGTQVVNLEWEWELKFLD